MSYTAAGEFALIVFFVNHISLPFVRVSQWGQPVSHFYSLKLNFALWHPSIHPLWERVHFGGKGDVWGTAGILQSSAHCREGEGC